VCSVLFKKTKLHFVFGYASDAPGSLVTSLASNTTETLGEEKAVSGLELLPALDNFVLEHACMIL